MGDKGQNVQCRSWDNKQKTMPYAGYFFCMIRSCVLDELMMFSVCFGDVFWMHWARVLNAL